MANQCISLRHKYLVWQGIRCGLEFEKKRINFPGSDRKYFQKTGIKSFSLTGLHNCTFSPCAFSAEDKMLISFGTVLPLRH